MTAKKVTENKPTLLIAEDEEDLRDLYSEILNTTCGTIINTSNGQEAIDAIKKGLRPDAILSDINMPQLTGLEFLKALRESGHETPFVVLTGFGDKHNTIQALRLGAMDFLEKPCDREKIIEVIARATKLGQLLKIVEKEVDEMVANMASEPENIHEIKHAMRSVLLMKKNKAG